jgi:hypothetical protein
MLPDPANPPGGIDFKKFADCVLKKVLGGADPKKAGSDCAQKFLKGMVKDPTDKYIAWLAHAGCCESYKEQTNFVNGDPCSYATRNGFPPGTPPKGPCWNSPFPEVVPDGGRPPQFCFECCQFKACVAGVRGILTGKIDPYSFLKCQKDCGGSL